MCSSSYIKGNGQFIEINFVGNISFELLPTFIKTDGSYTHPDINNGGNWKATDQKYIFFKKELLKFIIHLELI